MLPFVRTQVTQLLTKTGDGGELPSRGGSGAITARNFFFFLIESPVLGSCQVYSHGEGKDIWKRNSRQIPLSKMENHWKRLCFGMPGEPLARAYP